MERMKNSVATGSRLCSISSDLMISFMLQTHGTTSRTWITSSQGYLFKYHKVEYRHSSAVMCHWYHATLTHVPSLLNFAMATLCPSHT